MAGETVRGRAVELWGGLGYASVWSLLRRYQVAIVPPALVFVLALLVYLLSSPLYAPFWEIDGYEPIWGLVQGGGTAFNGPVRLADAFLHGRLDIANGPDLYWLDWAVYQGKYYVVEPAGTAIVVLPAVVLFGTDLNQTFVSVVVGAANAAVVYRLMRGLTDKVSLQIWLTLLFTFGTVYWWTAVDGGIWYFSHALAVLFLFLAIHETLVSKRPFLAGLFLGAAYFTRLPVLLAFPFFLIMFSDQWLKWASDRPLLERINFRPLLALGGGLGIFLALSFAYNYLRFDTPLPASYHYWMSHHKDGIPAGILSQGLFDISYIPRHIPVVFQKLPVFQSNPPYVLASWGGMAIWATTPAFLYGLFVGVRGTVVRAAWLGLILVPITLATLSATKIANWDLPRDVEVFPFLLLIAFGLVSNFKNKLVLASWAAILPIALTHFTVALTGWPQFGYRFALDYYPFLFLLLLLGIGDRLRWHHMLLIGASIVINVAGVLWVYQFDPNQVAGVRWVTWG